MEHVDEPILMSRVRVGFILASRIPTLAKAVSGQMLPIRWVTGWNDIGTPNVMRFRYIAHMLRRQFPGSVGYELYKPWRQYDAVVFLKSMRPACRDLAAHLQARGTRVIFDANVDYYTPWDENARAHFDNMAPTSEQQKNATLITRMADGVMSCSSHLTEVCRRVNPVSHWVQDNVPDWMIPDAPPRHRAPPGPLRLWWSGYGVKMFEFLLIEKPLLRFADRIHLHLVTDSVTATSRWPAQTRARFEQLMARVPHTIHQFTDIAPLLRLYSDGGGFILSPRYLDTPYNYGHSEYKISLGMACGLPAIASPVPSYLDLEKRAAPGAITICRTDDEWEAAFDAAASQTWSLVEGAAAARHVVQSHYVTSKVAPLHLNVCRAVCGLEPVQPE